MSFNDSVYDKVSGMIKKSNVSDSMKEYLQSLIDFAYNKCNPVRLANKGCD